MTKPHPWTDDDRQLALDFITNLQLYGFLGWGVLPSSRYPAHPLGRWGIFPAWCRWFYSDDGVPILANTDGMHALVIIGRSWQIIRGGRIPVDSEGPRRIIGGVLIAEDGPYVGRGWLMRLLRAASAAIEAVCDDADAESGVRRGTLWNEDHTGGRMFYQSAGRPPTRGVQITVRVVAAEEGGYDSEIVGQPGFEFHGDTPEDAARTAIDVALNSAEDRYDLAHRDAPTE